MNHMSDLNQSIRTLITVLKDEAEEMTIELKDISTKIDAELDTENKTSLNKHD